MSLTLLGDIQYGTISESYWSSCKVTNPEGASPVQSYQELNLDFPVQRDQVVNKYFIL